MEEIKKDIKGGFFVINDAGFPTHFTDDELKLVFGGPSQLSKKFSQSLNINELGFKKCVIAKQEDTFNNAINRATWLKRWKR